MSAVKSEGGWDGVVARASETRGHGTRWAELAVAEVGRTQSDEDSPEVAAGALLSDGDLLARLDL